jgi:hypothetical protein
MFDQRLYNQTAGLDSGFRGDDVYDVYDKPLFHGEASSSIYRPKVGTDSDQYGGGNIEEIGRMLGNERFRAAGLGASSSNVDASVSTTSSCQRCLPTPVYLRHNEMDLYNLNANV